MVENSAPAPEMTLTPNPIDGEEAGRSPPPAAAAAAAHIIVCGNNAYITQKTPQLDDIQPTDEIQTSLNLPRVTSSVRSELWKYNDHRSRSTVIRAK